MKHYLKQLYGKPLSALIFGSPTLAVVLLYVSFALPISHFWRFTIAAIIASPFILRVPITETYYRTKDGSISEFLREVFSSWKKLTLLTILIGSCAYFGKTGLPWAIAIGIAVTIVAPLHGAMSASFFMRMGRRGLL